MAADKNKMKAANKAASAKLKDALAKKDQARTQYEADRAAHEIQKAIVERDAQKYK